jgi:hypothetical protein
MVKKEEALAKRDEKRQREKYVTCATFINLKKQPIEVQKIKAEAKLLMEENRIILADLRTRSWTQNKGLGLTRSEPSYICQRDVWSSSHI